MAIESSDVDVILNRFSLMLEKPVNLVGIEANGVLLSFPTPTEKRRERIYVFYKVTSRLHIRIFD